MVQMHLMVLFTWLLAKGSSGVFTLRADVVSMSLPALSENFHLTE
jgi:hypothetical protein